MQKSVESIERISFLEDDFSIDVHHSVSQILDLRIRHIQDISHPAENFELEISCEL